MVRARRESLHVPRADWQDREWPDTAPPLRVPRARIQSRNPAKAGGSAGVNGATLTKRQNATISSRTGPEQPSPKPAPSNGPAAIDFAVRLKLVILRVWDARSS